jgi:hypothetical protein
MARYASEAKAGYFPTPPEQMAFVCERLTVCKDVKVNLFDPCCGTGAALRQMADNLAGKGAVPQTFGCELEKDRAKKAEAVLDHVVAASYEELVMTNNAVTIIWLNPPYQQGNNERLEVTFLRDLTRTRLQPGGLLMYCIPRQILSKAALLLANRFRDIKVYRFSNPDYFSYGQVVVFGYKRERDATNDEIQQTREWLKETSRMPSYVVPALDNNDGVTFSVPAATKEMETYRSEHIDPEVIISEIQGSTLYNRVEEMLLPPGIRNRRNVKMETPITPLSLSHYATIIASGAAGGNMGTHIVEGSTREVTEKNNYNKDTELVTTRHVAAINIFSKENGVVSL